MMTPGQSLKHGDTQVWLPYDINPDTNQTYQYPATTEHNLVTKIHCMAILTHTGITRTLHVHEGWIRRCQDFTQTLQTKVHIH